MNRHYLTLREAFGDDNISWEIITADLLIYNWSKYITQYTLPIGGHANILFKKHLVPRYWKSFVTYIDGDITVDKMAEVTSDFKGLVYAWLLETEERYDPLIKALEDNKTKLLDRLQSVSFVRFNDTPQSSSTGGFDNDNYASTTTKTVNEADTATIIQRINEIDLLIHSYYQEWAKDFGRFVIND